MIVRKTSAVGLTEFSAVRSMSDEQIQTLFATPQRGLAARNFLELLDIECHLARCRIKNPVPHPLSTAVKAAISRSNP